MQTQKSHLNFFGDFTSRKQSVERQFTISDFYRNLLTIHFFFAALLTSTFIFSFQAKGQNQFSNFENQITQNNKNNGGCLINRRADFNGDGKTDFSIFRPSSGVWYIQPNNAGNQYAVAFGMNANNSSIDSLQPVDFDGDGKSDIGLFRQTTGVWHWIRSSDNAVRSFQFGAATQSPIFRDDIPVAGDYTGDGKAELAIYRRSTGVWYIYDTEADSYSPVQWGGDPSDVPAIGDYDGDCRIDYAVRRSTGENSTNSTRFYILLSGGGTYSVIWGNSNKSQLAIGDYDGDGRSDIGVVLVSNLLRYWYVVDLKNRILVNGVQFGEINDFSVPGDYDGDGKNDLAAFRSTNGVFYYRSSINNLQYGFAYGMFGDVPTNRIIVDSPRPAGTFAAETY